MLQQSILTILLLAICVVLIAIGTLLGRGEFKIGHACRMKFDKKKHLKSAPADSTSQETTTQK